MMRGILYATECKMNGNGIDLVVAKQIDALAAAGYPVELVARGRYDAPGMRNRTWRLPPSKLLSWLPSKDYYAANSRCFSWLGARYLDARRHRLAIAWTHTAHDLFGAARRQGIPCVLNAAGPHRLHNPRALVGLRWPRLPLERTLEEYRRADRILVASDFAAATFVAHGVPTDKIRVVYRGADLSAFCPPAVKPSRPFIVASCGLLGDRKGTYQLLRAWRQAALPEAELWLIGHVPANEAEKLHALATPSVRFFGFRRDLPALLGQAHLHVLLSRNEGFAKVTLEAAAAGAVNLCTAETGLPPDAPGALFIADRDDIDRVATLLADAHAHTDDCVAQGLQARAYVAEHFTWEAFGARVVAAVRELLPENTP